MSETNKEIVEKANALLAEGKTEEFLQLCAEDVEWTLLAETPSKMKGREAIRKFMASSQGSEPPLTKLATIKSEHAAIEPIANNFAARLWLVLVP